jgi:DNA/RNA endonuclease G (NUC1)
MAAIFLSFRHEDAEAHAHRIYDRLKKALGTDHVFIDRNSIEPGADWQEELDRRLGQACLLIAIIGPRWRTGAGTADRLLEETDMVRRELATAFAKGTAVLPVLVDGATLPDKRDLPIDVSDLSGRQALTLPTEDQYFDAGIAKILKRHRKLCTARSRWQVPRATLAAGVALLLACGAGGAYWFSRSALPNFVVSVFRDAPVTPIGARVHVRSLLSNDQQTSETDADGHARFQLRNADLVQLRVTLLQEAPCRTTLLPAFSPRELPALNPVDIATISARFWKQCGETTGTAPENATTGRSVPAATLRSIGPGDTRGDSALLRFHLPWGTPAAEFVVARRPYAYGFDPSRKLARWVAYRIQRGDLRRRRPPIYPLDPELPADVQVRPDAYDQNPYDRGNLVNRADVSALDEDAEDETFYMSVIAPQTDYLNRQIWTRIEQVSTLQSRSAKVWVIAGPAFVAEEGESDIHYAVLPGDIAIPTHFFRIMVREGNDGRQETLAFLVPNGFSQSRDISSYLTSVGRIEQVTGLKFFAESPRRQELGSRVARQLWPPASPDGPEKPEDERPVPGPTWEQTHAVLKRQFLSAAAITQTGGFACAVSRDDTRQPWDWQWRPIEEIDDKVDRSKMVCRQDAAVIEQGGDGARRALQAAVLYQWGNGTWTVWRVLSRAG